ncbi:sortase A [Microbacterium resistens]|uniref:Sortase A n=1 Tax=Microbacterium resistens TaxID=156977 RepID=A0ABU1SED8_9MICO|nr:class E sortase [Microbacterium resistens]MDR6867932.1 sortase A [Microbacterium resistens]
MTPTVDVPRRARRRRPRVTVTGVIGELLLTAGVLVLLFVAWQMWVGDWIMAAEGDAEGSQISQEWAQEPPPAPPALQDPATPDAAPQYEPPLMTAPGDGEYFAQMIIPRFGADYNRILAGGVTRPVTLDNGWIGVYPQSAMPGQVGNFSVAGHRTTWGKPLNQIDQLRLNDPIVVETREGWYVYRFRTLEYVTPDRVSVLEPVPEAPGLQTGERYITLTACSPLYSLAERIIAYGVFDRFQPRADGAPVELTEGGL